MTLSKTLVERAKLDRKAIEGVSVTALGPQQLRGVSEPMDCYRLEIDTD